MSQSTKALITPSCLRTACEDLSVDDLEKAHRDLLQIIEEEKERTNQQELKRKGERSLQDMRALMAKAGISMTEFQAALGD